MKKAFNIAVYIFAAIGFFLVIGYTAIRLHLTNTPGIIENDQDRFLKNYEETTTSYPAATSTITSPTNGSDPMEVLNTSKNKLWNQGEEWQTFKDGVAKDVPVLNRVEAETGISARLIVAQLAVEQLRLFYSEREIFKQFFEPLKILGSQSQFSWGVMGIKEETAEKVENNLKDPASVFYPGPTYEHMLDFQTNDPGTERFNRIIDQHNHYWSYLYTALYLKEIESQWQKAGFNISENVGVLSTLYNIGFEHSIPKAAPEVGGAAIPIGNQTYSFGGLAYDVYYSNELLDQFPRK